MISFKSSDKSNRIGPWGCLVALGCLLLGGVTFLVGMGAAFAKPSPQWANAAMGVGVIGLICGGLMSLVALVAESMHSIKHRHVSTWLVGIILLVLCFLWIMIA